MLRVINRGERWDDHLIGYSRTHPRTFLPVTVTVMSYKNVGGYIALAGTLTNEPALLLEDIRGLAWTGSGGDQRHVRAFAPRLAPFGTVPFSTSIDNVNYFPGSDAMGILVNGACHHSMVIELVMMPIDAATSHFIPQSVQNAKALEKSKILLEILPDRVV